MGSASGDKIREVMGGPATSRAYLTKTRYLDGLRCTKRVWLRTYAPQAGTPHGPAAQARLETGDEVGSAAHGLFPGGVLVEETDWERALARTSELMGDPSVPTIFEGAFEHRRIRIRVDALERLDGSAWGLREVKSSTGVKHEHLNDIAIQYFVLSESGVPIPSAELIHVDRSYQRGPDGIDWQSFFMRTDLTDEIERAVVDVPNRTAEFTRVLEMEEPPPIEPAHHCSNPYDCEFKKFCTSDKPVDWIFYLPGLTRIEYQKLIGLGIQRIRDIPAGHPMSDHRGLDREAIQSGRAVCTGELGEALSGFGPPAFYLDFETMNPAIPLYEGTHPYDVIPFQWSLHRVDSDGSVSHRGFLADGRSDPRRELSETLIEALRGSEDPVIVYSSFERTRLSALGRELPELEPDLDRICGRLLDLYDVVRSHVYHPDFRGSFSLKSVGPALVPGLTYDDLAEVAGGQDASAAFLRVAQGRTTADEEARIRTALLEYCSRDTWALVELHRTLLQLGR
jgi:predicted RecB family nuclease